MSELRRQLEVNTTGTFLVIREVATVMKAQELLQLSSPLGDYRGATRGAIVVLGSASSYVATPGMGMYTASKHAIMDLVKNAGESRSPSQTLVPLYSR
jgi:NAD(P)-dependent dehydrogenase (short-subunit alcohol dehydrogenase family)